MLSFAADTVIVFLAASLAKPLQPILDNFAARTHIVVLRETGASLEHVRKITELKRIPDLVMLADAEVFPQYLVPAYASWYTEFARNRMIIAYTNKSKHASEINALNWYQIVSRPDVQVGRTDPDLAPAGYRTLIMMQLAEKHYKVPGLARRLLANAPPRNVRPNAAELAALLSAGELDYIYEYQSVSESYGLKLVSLPDEVDLGNVTMNPEYAKVSVDVRGPTRGARTKAKGQAIRYGVSIPRNAPHPNAATRLYQYLMTFDVAEQLRHRHMDIITHPVVHGSGAPPQVSENIRRRP